MSIWDEMLDAFRALGGTADNVRQGTGALGRGLFAVDPGRPVAIRSPENLLFDIEDVMFDGGALKLKPDAKVGAGERRFFEDYQAAFSWGGGGRAEVERVVEESQALPEELRRDLLAEYRCGLWFEPWSETLVQSRFLASRQMVFKERTVLMPVLELANHGRASIYELGEGISVNAQVKDEVLVRYSDVDSYGVFQSWGFAVEQPQAMSIALGGQIGTKRLQIARDFGKSTAGLWIPDIAAGEDSVRLSYLLTGNRQYPRLCRGIFYKLMREAGLAGYEEAFDMVAHTNRMHFLRLLAALEGVDGAMARKLRLMARLQLETLSFAYGVRAV